MFVDRVRIQARGGDGGAGVASFHRQKGRPRGKPNGGSGGRGGNVVVEADAGVPTLLRYDRRPHWRAGDGTHGQGDNKHGKLGTDLVLSVPLGTLVYDEHGTLLADLVAPGQRLIVAEGGRGGRGNAALVRPERKVPTYAEQGEYGDAHWVTLELKLLADAALIGFPNAGKSTLISKVSAARPKVADYPFTTLEPHLGVVEVGDTEFVLADIPGLIEGAAEGKGLGHEFLRHTERARVLVILLDPTPLQTVKYRDQYRILIEELDRHSPQLAQRPRLVALNKIDTLPELEESSSWAAGEHIDLFPISAVTGDGVDRLMFALAEAVSREQRAAPEREGFVLHRPLPPSFSIARDGDVWVVAGKAAERAVNLDDLTRPEAADLAAARLEAAGITQALYDAGAEAGDDVRIGDIVFTFHPSEDRRDIQEEEE